MLLFVVARRNIEIDRALFAGGISAEIHQRLIVYIASELLHYINIRLPRNIAVVPQIKERVHTATINDTTPREVRIKLPHIDFLGSPPARCKHRLPIKYQVPLFVDPDLREHLALR